MREERFLAGRRILVVEDLMLIALDLAGTIEDLGGDVCGTAATVREAMRAIEEERPDGVLLDINLAGESAFPIAEELMRRGIPFIFMTGYDELPADFARKPFLTKPFDYAEVRTRMRSVFVEQQPAQQMA